MDETDLITSIQSHLESALSEPVKTGAMEDERPVPAIIIDDWDTRDLNLNNSAKAGEAHGDFNGDGTKTHEWYLNFSFTTRVELLFRHSDEVDVSRLKESGKQLLRFIREDPQSLHEDLTECQLGSDGNPTYTFTEPRESELMLSARFYGDHTVTRTPGDTKEDVIEQVKDAFTFNP